MLINRDKILPRYRETIGNNLTQLEQFITQQQGRIDWVKPDAGTTAYPYFTEENFDVLSFSKKLVEQKGVLLLPGEAFDMPKHFRIALGADSDSFQEALLRFSSLAT
jgi:aspartate/methionine/tyrosine aminotransferase